MFKKIIQSARIGVGRFLRRGSANLSRRWNSLSTGMQKTFLFFFCLLAGIACIGIVTKGFYSPGQLPRIHPITLPRHVIEQPVPRGVLHPPEREAVFLVQVRLFRLYLDSLQHSVTGKHIYDSLAAARPGLLDTLQRLETFYHLK